MAFPTAPPAAGEQLALPLAGTLAGRYQAWRRTPEGCIAFTEIERRVVARSNNGEERVEINAVFASVRHDLKIKLNHDHRALVARELIARHPELALKIKTRRRRAV